MNLSRSRSVPTPSPLEPENIYESHNLCFSGTSVVGGDAIALVTGDRCAYRHGDDRTTDRGDDQGE
ncbi:MAG: hypothetical protein M0C28_17260 [Candidatus Moduliflexus flocculans]|nr:hypothetical protein [Candidatus Moduliflexus flocculans]